MTQTPILQGCTDSEIQEMSKQVGGLMNPGQVGDAFEELLAGGQSGDIMAVWVDAPPYYIPDTAMGLFIAFTTCAMMFRFVPRGLTPKALRLDGGKLQRYKTFQLCSSHNPQALKLVYDLFKA